MNDQPTPSKTPRTDAIQRSACDDTGRLCRPELLWSGLEQFEKELAAAREELATVTEQRDRLAEALKEIINLEDPYITWKQMQKAKQALQSLNQNETNPAAGSK